MIFNHIFFIYFFLFFNEAQNQNPEWCWTVPNMKIKVVENEFGYNYGLCEEENEGSAPESKTKITVKMHNMEGFGGQSGPFRMRLSSKDIEGDEFILNAGPFKPDENYEATFDMPSVGEIQQLEILMDDKDNGMFICDNIIIEEGSKNFEFKCAGILDKKNKQLFLTKEETVEYEITMRAGKEGNEQTSDPIFVAIKGAKGDSPFLVFSEDGIQAEPEQNTLEFPNLGHFQCLYVKTYGEEELLLTKIILQSNGGSPIEFENEDRQVLGCPSNCQLAFCKGGSAPAPSNNPPDNDDEDAGIDDEDDSITVEDSPYPESHKYNCAKLTVSEKENLKFLSCKTTAEQYFDDLHYINNNINYEMKFGICPPNCAKDAIVMGRGIHNPSSTVCGSAIADGSIPKSGGCLSISRVKGQNTYGRSVVTNGITVEGGSGSDWGFTTFKADNPDFAKSDIRILNHKGEPDYQGRVEFRITGFWGTININGCDQSSAKYICKALNYIDGEWMNDLDANNFCETYLDKDHCGFKGQYVHYTNYKCDGEIESLADCYREMATEFNHGDDAIIKCTMVDKSQTKEVQPGEGDIRVVGTDGAPAQGSTGRVELFHSGSWGTVCNKGFTDDSANVACKQIGFEGGKAIGAPGSHKSCILGKEDYCEEEGKKMQVEGLKCTGTELKLIDCGGNFSSSCSNFQSAMVKCDGSEGDTSGQKPPPGAPPQKTPIPKLGNLPLANPYKLSCETTLNPLDFPGNPGSIYLAFCPEGCQNSDAILRGTSIYTYDSSICKAAIHSGVLQHKGGGFTIIITYGQGEYEGSLNRQIGSEKFKYSKKSFIIGKEISIHKGWSLANYFAPYVDLRDLHTKQKTQPPLKFNPTSFIQVNSKIVHKQISTFAQNFKKYIQKSALLQLQNSKEKKIFEWYTKKNFVFSEENKIDTTGMEQDDSLQQMTKFTILLQFIVEKDNGPVEIFGHSECQCWGLILDEDGLKFGSKCTDAMQILGFQVAAEKKYHLGLAYDSQNQNLVVAINGEQIFNDKIKFDFQCNQKVNIGYNSFSESKFFLGKIDYINVLDKPLPPSELQERTDSPIPSPSKSPSNGGDTPDGQKNFRNTQDNRKCVSPCITDPFPEQENSPDPPPPAQLGAPPTGPGGEGLEDDDEEEEEKEDEKPPQNPDCIDLQCVDTLLLPIFQGEVGKSFCVFCPPGCLKQESHVIGSQIYFDESSICRAGIHDGKLNNSEGGEMELVLANPLQKYYGTHENEINSKYLQTQEPSNAFVLRKVQKIFELKCDQIGTDPLFVDAVAPVRVKCPARCSYVTPQTSYGNLKYTDTSSICQAAIHSGASSDNGGHFSVQFTKPEPVYDEFKKNQITSSKWDNANNKVKRSMIFIVNKPQTAGFFFEKCDDDDLFSRWQKVDDNGSIKGPSDWKCLPHPLDNEKMVLTQVSPINVTQAGQYSTKLIHRDFDNDNGLFKLNIWQYKKSIFAIFIRYYDENNYYAFKFNTKQESSILLVKRHMGIEKVLASYDEDLPIKIWIRLYIVFDEQSISLNMQQGDFRNVPKIISVIDSDIQRGKIAFATNDDGRVFFDGITVQTYNINEGIMDQKSQNLRIWDQCLKPANLKHREVYCQKKNGSAKWAIPICKKLINYCDYCCTEIIPKWERIIHYTCQKTCTLATRRYEQFLRDQQNDTESKPYVPQKGDKIDFFVTKSQKFIPAIVKDVKNGEEDNQLIVQVSYFVANGEYAKETVEFPNKLGRIQKCKQILKTRNDC